MGKDYKNMKNKEVFYKKDNKYYPIKKKSFAELNAIKKKKKDALGEIKFHAVSVSLNMSGTPNITELSLIAQGVNSDERIGNVIKCYSLAIKGLFEQNSGTTEGINVRVVLFIDWQNQGSTPLITDLFLDAVSYNRNLPRLSESFKYVRFTFLMDKYYVKQSTGVDLAGTGLIVFTELIDIYKQIKHKIYFSASSGAEASMSKGALFIIFSDRIGQGAIRFISNLKYTDV